MKRRASQELTVADCWAQRLVDTLLPYERLRWLYAMHAFSQRLVTDLVTALLLECIRVQCRDENGVRWYFGDNALCRAMCEHADLWRDTEVEREATEWAQQKVAGDVLQVVVPLGYGDDSGPCTKVYTLGQFRARPRTVSLAVRYPPLPMNYRRLSKRNWGPRDAGC